MINNEIINANDFIYSLIKYHLWSALYTDALKCCKPYKKKLSWNIHKNIMYFEWPPLITFHRIYTFRLSEYCSGCSIKLCCCFNSYKFLISLDISLMTSYVVQELVSFLRWQKDWFLPYVGETCRSWVSLARNSNEVMHRFWGRDS